MENWFKCFRATKFFLHLKVLDVWLIFVLLLFISELNYCSACG